MKEKSNYISMIVVPVVFMILILLQYSGGNGYVLKVGIVDYDQTELTRMLQYNLSEKSNLILLTEENLYQDMIDRKIDYGVVIPEGFTQDLIRMNSPQLEGYRITESNITLPTIYYIENFMNSVNNIALAAQGNEGLFYEGLEVYQRGLLSVENTTIYSENAKSEGITVAGLGFIVMGMMYFSTFSANMILLDRENKTFYRILSSPVKIKRYMAENLLSFLFLSQVQILLLFSIMHFIFKMNLGPSIFNLYIVLLSYSLVCVAFGIALTALAKDSRQASSIASFLVTPMVMLGGGFWSREIMPQSLQNIGNFVPITWVLKAAEKVLYGDQLLAVGRELFILFLFAMTFFLLGTWKKTDISH